MKLHGQGAVHRIRQGVGLACEWMLGQIDTTLEEIAEVYEQSIPDPLKKYLL